MALLPIHVELLHAAFERRRARNPRYSIRAFAKHMSLHPSSMCRILAAKQKISVSSARVFLDRLDFDDRDKVAFAASLSHEKAREVWKDLAPYLCDNAANARAENQSNEERDRELVEFLPQPCWIMDKTLKIKAANTSWRDLVAEPMKQLETWLDLLHFEDRAVFLEHWIRAGETVRAFEFECRFQVTDSAFKALSIRIMPIKDESGRVLRWLCIAKDMSSSEAVGPAAV